MFPCVGSNYRCLLSDHGPCDGYSCAMAVLKPFWKSALSIKTLRWESGSILRSESCMVFRNGKFLKITLMYNFWDGASLSFSGSDGYLLAHRQDHTFSRFQRKLRIQISVSQIVWLYHCTVYTLNLKGSTTCERTCDIQVSNQGIFFMEPPDSSLLSFGERLLSMSSRCGHWFWTYGWHLSYGLEIDFSLFALGYPQLKIGSASMKGKRSCSLIQRLWMWAESAPMHADMTYSGVFDSNDLLCFDLCNDPSMKAVFRD